jgi:hypothetical protein
VRRKAGRRSGDGGWRWGVGHSWRDCDSLESVGRNCAVRHALHRVLRHIAPGDARELGDRVGGRPDRDRVGDRSARISGARLENSRSRSNQSEACGRTPRSSGQSGPGYLDGVSQHAERAVVSSANYDLFEQAMHTRRQIVCMYAGHPRELCPVILGHSQGQEKALTYQIGGTSESGLPQTGEWRCLFLSKVRDAQLRDGPWLVGSGHTQPQGCVQIVDLDVNPSSPYRPKRKIRSTRRQPSRRTAPRRG